jgi:hypothetical protein
MACHKKVVEKVSTKDFPRNSQKAKFSMIFFSTRDAGSLHYLICPWLPFFRPLAVLGPLPQNWYSGYPHHSNGGRGTKIMGRSRTIQSLASMSRYWYYTCELGTANGNIGTHQDYLGSSRY